MADVTPCSLLVAKVATVVAGIGIDMPGPHILAMGMVPSSDAKDLDLVMC
jgi:hypothetical protein